jgi:Oxidoreductase FAD-binding domain
MSSALLPSGLYAERVTDVQHYTDRLFRFRITRPQSLRFRSGEFVMLGLPQDGKPLMRAYSIASPAWDESKKFNQVTPFGSARKPPALWSMMHCCRASACSCCLQALALHPLYR